jgi:predicted dehydrogenase
LIRWGVLGTARTARKRLLPSILRAGQSIAAITGRCPHRVTEFQREFGIPRARPWNQAQNLLDDPEIDAVYIPLPNSLHAEWTVRSLEAGKNVLCEKPLALNLAEAERILSTSRAHGRVVMENFSYHLKAGQVFDLPDREEAVSIDIQHSFLATEEHRLRYDPLLGGGSFLDLGCYGVDFVHRLLDCEIEILDVLATPPAPERRAWGMVDETCVVRGNSGGMNISITSSFAQPPRQDFTLRFADREELRITRTDDAVAMLRSFAGMREVDPADILRWRRNAAVLEKVQARIARQLQT